MEIYLSLLVHVVIKNEIRLPLDLLIWGCRQNYALDSSGPPYTYCWYSLPAEKSFGYSNYVWGNRSGYRKPLSQAGLPFLPTSGGKRL